MTDNKLMIIILYGHRKIDINTYLSSLDEMLFQSYFPLRNLDNYIISPHLREAKIIHSFLGYAMPSRSFEYDVLLGLGWRE